MDSILVLGSTEINEGYESVGLARDVPTVDYGA
jgi:hypothetical protein